ncbi:MAG: sigma-70 family RNA polymerase sigma factor [Gammaproteobacteria bacterium]|nr:sigma-70 family RNA polymerase sigma factor [Gammaproteobacteria bacterium]
MARSISRGDRDALRVFFDDHYAPIYRYCLRYVSIPDAEELATDTLCHAIRRIETYRGDASLSTWVTSVARSQVSMHFKKQNRQPPIHSIDANEHLQRQIEGMAADLETPEKAQEQTERQALVHRLLDSLPRDYGDILELKYIDGLSVDEIAHRLATTTTSIQSKLARARDAFKTNFNSAALDPAPPESPSS